MRVRDLNAAAFLFGFFFAVLMIASPAQSQTRQQGPWWPSSLWGPDDQAGASNWITPEKILEAVALVRTGQFYELGYPYARGMPLLGERTYASFLIPGRGTRPDALVFNDDYLAAEIGQVGTQLDGLGHVGRQVTMEDGSVADVFYNGITLDEMRSQYGLVRLGVEHMRPFLTRGILIDLAAHLGPLPNEYDATLADVKGALAAQAMDDSDIRPGDAIIINLGWSDLWATPERVTRDWRNRPGVTRDVLDWLVAKEPALVGWDTAADGTGHAVLTTYNGIPSLEFMNLATLSNDRVFEFMFVFTPLRLAGATGSPGRPIAVR